MNIEHNIIKYCIDSATSVFLGDSARLCLEWDSPTVIVSDGAYGISGFEGDPSSPKYLAEWYEPHIEVWSKCSTHVTTLWFWNSEVGWASVHPLLQKHGWRYVHANIWDKGKGHIAGNVNTGSIRHFPIATEICVQYVFEPGIGGLNLKDWLRREWRRTGLPWNTANEACGVSDAATRKYLSSDGAWYFPPKEKFEKLRHFANKYGEKGGKPYFSLEGVEPNEDWSNMRAKFKCPYGFTNVWNIAAPRGNKRSGHPNEKPLEMMSLLIEASSDISDTVWEPFGGTFSVCAAARRLGRKSFGAETNKVYFEAGVRRLLTECRPV